MSLNKQELIENLKQFLEFPSSEMNEQRWQQFWSILKSYEPISQIYMKTIEDFDKAHGILLDILFNNENDSAPLIDRSKYDKLEVVFNDFGTIFKLIIQEHLVLSQRLDHVERNLNSVQHIVYENQYNRLCFSVSTPLKSVLVQKFRLKSLRIDPLDQALLMSLYANDYQLGDINKDLFKSVCQIYKTIANDLSVPDYKDLIEIIMSRQKRNVEEHETLGDYIKKCKILQMKPTFKDLIAELNLNALFEFKPSEMKTLEIMFNYYTKDNQYR